MADIVHDAATGLPVAIYCTDAEIEALRKLRAAESDSPSTLLFSFTGLPVYVKPPHVQTQEQLLWYIRALQWSRDAIKHIFSGDDAR